MSGCKHFLFLYHENKDGFITRSSSPMLEEMIDPDCKQCMKENPNYKPWHEMNHKDLLDKIKREEKPEK